MIVDRFVTPELAQVAYAVGDLEVRKVAIIDPRRDVADYVEWANRHQLAIAAILETHVHADFVSGAPELARATGAPVYISRRGKQEFEHVPVDPGWTLDVGSVRLTAVHTPGHTPEHLSWLAEDANAPEAAPALFSGDALFVGEVGRPDLFGTNQTDALMHELYGTVMNVLSRLDDATIVYPGHTAGSSCGKNIGRAPYTTIGREKATNYAFQPWSESEFSRAVMYGMPQSPAYYPILKKLNRIGAPCLASYDSLQSLRVEQVEEYMASGALVLDVRSPEEFAAGHIPDSISVGVGPNFSTWMGWLAPYDRDVVLIAYDTHQAREALAMLRRIGIDRVVGYHVGVLSWGESGRLLMRLDVVTADEVMAEQEGGGEPLVLDVRSDGEYADDHIDGSKHQFLGKIARSEMPDLGRNCHITIVCGSGYRSTVAASLMMANGFRHLRNLSGGMNAWNERKAGIRPIAC